jgi:hypothetical protein
MLKHLLVIVVQGNSIWFEVLLSPLELFLVWRKGGNELSAWSLVENTQRMTSSHTAEAGYSNLESARSHCEQFCVCVILESV